MDFNTIQRAMLAGASESDELDWKEQLPRPSADGTWNEFSKDVAAMANTRGGLLVYGVSNDCQLTGVPDAEVDVEKYASWVRRDVQPYLPDLDQRVLTADDGSQHIFVVDVPASPMAPHFVYGGAARDKSQMAAVVPYRDGPNTAWMAEHQISRAYQARFAAQGQAQADLDANLAYAADLCFGEDAEPQVWLLVASRPHSTVPLSSPRISREAARRIGEETASTISALELNSIPLLASTDLYPRVGFRRWLISNLGMKHGHPVLAEIHDDGSTTFAVNTSWKSLVNTELIVDLPVHTGTLRRGVYESIALVRQTQRALRTDCASDVTVTLQADTAERTPFSPIVIEQGFVDIPSTCRNPRRILPASSTLTPVADDTTLLSVADELIAGLLNQFGLEHRPANRYPTVIHHGNNNP